MSDKKYADDDPERTLVTLDQLSQTIEVMTSVVNRLRRHLSDQINAQLESKTELKDELELLAAAQEMVEAKIEKEPEEAQKGDGNKRERESFVVEISQQEVEPLVKSSKTLH